MKNILRLARVYRAYKTGKTRLPYTPLRLWIEPTNHCNLRCQMCPQGQKEKTFEKGFMDFSVFTKLIREASSFGADVNLFMGGESLLHPQLCDMIAYCRDQGVPSRLYTNATLLDEEKSEGIIRSGLDHMTFSFDGVDKALYEETRRGARYEKTLENVRRFLAVKKSKGQRAPTVVIQCLELGRRPYSREARRNGRTIPKS